MTHKDPAPTREKRRRVLRAAIVLAAAALAAAAAVAAAPRQELARYQTINAGLGSPSADVGRSTPAAAWRSFLALAGAGRFEQAAHLLDLSGIPPAQQQTAGARTGEQLYRVLQLLKARADAVTTEDEVGPAFSGQPSNVVVALRFDRGGISGEVLLRHAQGVSPYELVWLFSRKTVASVPFWYRVLVKGGEARGAEPLDVGLGPIPADIQRGTPREAVAGFLAACQEGRFDLAAYYLDLGAIPQERQSVEGARLARRLMLVLQRTGWVSPDKLSNESLGTPETGVPENEQLFGVVEVRHQPVELLLAHRSDAELGNVWTVSQDTVAQIDRLYDAHGYGWLGDHAPLVLFTIAISDVQLWQWMAILAGLLASGLLSKYLGHWLARLLQRVARRTAVGWNEAVAWALDGPTAYLLSAVFLLLVARWLGVTPEAWKVVRYTSKLLALGGIGWFLVRLVDATAARVRETAKQGSQVGLGFLPMTVRFAKFVIVVLVLLATLDVVGVNVLSAMVGLGLGGVAIAFAAQKTLENLFGTASIASDRPFEVGHFVTIGQDSGTVEEVGFRSTRLRTLGRTVVTIPNGLIASGRVENFSARDRIMYNPVLKLTYAATAAQLAYVVDEIKRLLRSHPKVFQGEQRVRFSAFGESSLLVEVWCWVETRNFIEYTRVVEELNFAILEIVERAGTSFALPGRAVHLAKDGVTDAARVREIEKEVERRRESGELAALDGTVAPPDGPKR
jgi:MscS family membrane protein